MYKTVWYIIENEHFKIEFTQYHFGKTPKFPSWYMQEGVVYDIEAVWTMKLISSFKMFKKCLFGEYAIR